MKNIKRQLSFLYLRTFAAELRPADAVWVALLAARGFPLWQIGLAEGVFHAVSLMGEVPSGMAADLLGRRRTLAASALMGIAYALLMADAAGLAEICLALGLRALAYNLASGTLEALTFDSLKAADRADDYLHVSANIDLLQQLAGALGALFSLLDGVLGYAGFYLAAATSEGAALLATLGLREPVLPAPAHTNKQSRSVPAQIAAHTRASAAVLRQSPAAVRIISADAAVCLPVYLTSMFLQQRLTEQGWPTRWLFAPSLLAAAAGMVGTALGRQLRPHRLRGLYPVCALLCGAGTLLVGLAPAWGGLAGVMLVQAVVNIWSLHALRRLQELFPSEQRATLLSVDSMAYSLLMIPASPLVGLAADLTGRTGAGLAALGCAVALSALVPPLAGRAGAQK